MRVREIVARARAYEEAEDAWPAESLLSVLIDLFTSPEPEAAAALAPAEVQRAWRKLTRDLSPADWRIEARAFADGVDVLAANLTEAGADDLAVRLRELHEPRFEGAIRSPDVSRESLRAIDEPAVPAEDGPMWVPRGRRLAL
ncbi:MAG TPA: hypothetical protein VKV26_07045 [Dehalococcoidia bacterium]|nr:hypothetical protein [Dehalococcoidia bacterium]